MKNRRLLAILIVFIIIAGVMIAGGTIFRVRHVNISFVNPPDYILDDRPNVIPDLRARIDFVQGRNILFSVDRDRIIREIEEEDFRVRVIGRPEARFPNRLYINIRERYPVFETVDSNGRTMLFDSQFRFVTTTRRVGINLIQICETIYDNVDLDELELGQFLFELEMEDNIRSKVERKRDLADLFQARGSYEDTLNTHFRTIEFEPIGTYADGAPRDMMILDMRDFNTRFEIWGISDRYLFRDMLTEVWRVFEFGYDGIAPHQPGIYRVQIANGRIVPSYRPY